MSLRRAAVFLLARRFSPRVIPNPRTPPARSFHSLMQKDLPIVGHGLRGAGGASVAAAAFAGVGTLVVQYFMEVPAALPAREKETDQEEIKALGEYFRKESAPPPASQKEIEEEMKALAEYFRKGPDDDESAARKKEDDMKARFENWMKSYGKTYRDEKEKAMRFQVFKDSMKWIESQPPSTQKKLLPGNGFADLRSDEYPCSQSCCCIDDSDDPDIEEYRENKFMAENEDGDTFIWKPEWKPPVQQEINRQVKSLSKNFRRKCAWFI